MVSDELITNSRRNMLETLADLSSPDRQRAYQSKVPYVHVPIELACQWEQFSDLLREQQWFRDALTPTEFAAATTFDREFNTVLDSIGDLPQLESLLADPRWQQVALAATQTLAAFQ